MSKDVKCPRLTSSHYIALTVSLAFVTGACLLQPTPTTEPQHSLGDTWTRPADEMAMVYVPTGEFRMGSDDNEVNYALQLCNEYYHDCERGWFEHAQPVHTVELDGFWIDQTEVSNEQYEKCVRARECDPPKVTDSFRSHYGDNAYDDYPVTDVAWYDAFSYCKWAGARLPTEAEWEYTARGPEGQIFPWGNEFDGTRLDYCDANCRRSSYKETGDWADETTDDGYADVAPVGSYETGASWCGALNLAGNVREWVADLYGDHSIWQQENPTGPSKSEYRGLPRVVRGGSWEHPPFGAYGAHRSWDFFVNRHSDVGFRCAKNTK